MKVTHGHEPGGATEVRGPTFTNTVYADPPGHGPAIEYIDHDQSGLRRIDFYWSWPRGDGNKMALHRRI